MQCSAAVVMYSLATAVVINNGDQSMTPLTHTVVLHSSCLTANLYHAVL
jgi:hypothetical protein